MYMSLDDWLRHPTVAAAIAQEQINEQSAIATVKTYLCQDCRKTFTVRTPDPMSPVFKHHERLTLIDDKPLDFGPVTDPYED